MEGDTFLRVLNFGIHGFIFSVALMQSFYNDTSFIFLPQFREQSLLIGAGGQRNFQISMH